MKTTNPMLLRSILAVLPMVAAGPAAAKEAHANLTVSATVTGIALLTAVSLPQALDVTAADLQRGYIDVPEPATLTVRSNSQSGFALDVLTVAPLLASMVVAGLASDQILGAGGGTIVQRWRAPGSINLSLQFRLILAPGLTPGRYPWPLRLTVRPLDGQPPLTASSQP